MKKINKVIFFTIITLILSGLTNINALHSMNAYKNSFEKSEFVYSLVDDVARHTQIFMHKWLHDYCLKIKKILNTNNNPTAIKFLSSKEYAYVVHKIKDNSIISVYKKDTSGGLELLQKVNAGGDSTSIAFDRLEKYAYVTNMQDNSISVYSINNNGRLDIVKKVNTGNSPIAITFDKSGQHAYVLNEKSDNVWIYTLESDGGLRHTKTVSTGISPSAITFNKSGNYAYIANSKQSTISIYKVENGNLNQKGTVNTGHTPTSIAFGNSGDYVYVTSTGENKVSIYKLLSNGLLEAISVVQTGAHPTSIVFDAAGDDAYVLNSHNASLSVYKTQSNGELRLFMIIPTQHNPASMAITSFKHAYVVNKDSHTISMYERGDVLTRLAAADTPFQGKQQYMMVEPSGKYLYLQEYSPHANIYRIENNGILTYVAQIPSIEINSETTGFFHPHYGYAYGPAGTNINIFKIESNGYLKKIGQVGEQGNRANKIKFDSAGKYAYVSYMYSSRNIQIYQFKTDGSLTKIDSIHIPYDYILDFSFSSSGDHFYVVSTSNILAYKVQSDGKLQLLWDIKLNDPTKYVNALKIVKSINAEYAYILHSRSDHQSSISIYRLLSDGKPEFIKKVDINSKTTLDKMVVSPSGKYLYLYSSSYNNRDCKVYKVENSGDLTYDMDLTQYTFDLTTITKDN